MQIEFFQTVADFRAAFGLHQRLSAWRRINSFFVYRIVPVLSALLIAFFLFQICSGRRPYSPDWTPIFVFLLLMLCAPALKYYAIGKQFNRMRPQAWREKKVEIELSDECVRSRVPGLAEARYSWETFSKFAQDEKITMLYLSKISFLFIPTSVFTPAQRTELANLVQRHGIESHIC